MEQQLRDKHRETMEWLVEDSFDGYAWGSKRNVLKKPARIVFLTEKEFQ